MGPVKLSLDLDLASSQSHCSATRPRTTTCSPFPPVLTQLQSCYLNPVCTYYQSSSTCVPFDQTGCDPLEAYANCLAPHSSIQPSNTYTAALHSPAYHTITPRLNLDTLLPHSHLFIVISGARSRPQTQTQLQISAAHLAQTLLTNPSVNLCCATPSYAHPRLGSASSPTHVRTHIYTYQPARLPARCISSVSSCPAHTVHFLIRL